MPKGEVFIWLPLDIQLFWLCKHRLIVIGGGIPCLNDSICRNKLSAKFNLCFGATENKPDWWQKTQDLFNSRWHEIGMLNKLFADPGILGKTIKRIGN